MTTWMAVTLVAVALPVAVSPTPANAAGWDGSFESVHLGTLDSGSGNAGAEIAVFDPETGRFFVTNGAEQRIDVFAADDLDPAVKAAPIGSIDLGADVQGVAVKNGVVAAALAGDPVTSPGEVAFFDADAVLPGTPTVRRYAVGALPDMVTFTPDGTKVLVANEGEPRCSSTDPTQAVNPEGSISIVDVATGATTTAGFGAFEAQRAALETAGLRLNWPGATLAQDVEPEYITVSEDGTTAWATLQEANAVAVIDIATSTVTSIAPLGLKDHSLAGNGLDASDRDLNGTDGTINITTRPVFGMYMPDAIDSFEVGGDTYLATANEGDGRDYFAPDGTTQCFLDEVRLRTAVTSGNTAIPGAATLRDNAVAGRLKLTNTALSIIDGGQYTRLANYGARSFSIWDDAGTLVFDSGDAIEQYMATDNAAFFNANFEFNGTETGGQFAFDTRSDDKGPEPEAVAVGDVFGKKIAFVGLERASGVMAFDVTDPMNVDTTPLFWERSTTNYTATELPLADIGDISPESVAVVPAEDSPTGFPLMYVSYELSGTTSVFQMTPTDGVTLPSAPQSVTAAGRDSSVVVSWAAPASDGGTPVTGYTAVAMPGGASCTTTGATTCTIPDLANGTSYEVSVRASTLAGTSPAASALFPAMPAVFSLDVIHINDHHSRLTADTVVLQVPGGTATFPRGGFPRVVAAIDWLRDGLGPDANVVTAHAGDALTGSLYYTLFAGEADAALMNEVCFDLFTLGNHEFDAGDQALADFLDMLDTAGCDTPVLSANVVPELGTPLAPVSETDYIEPFLVKEYNGEEVAFIGLTIAQKTQVSSQPLESTQFLDEVETMQTFIDQLEGVGIDKIIGVTHYGYDNDLAMVAELDGIDAVVGGDSHTLLGDFGAYGLPTEGDYPTVATDMNGDNVCVVQAWQYSHVVGHLNIGFDADGDVTTCNGTPYLLLGDATAATGTATITSANEVAAADAELLQIAPDAGATATLQSYTDEVTVLSEQVIGEVTAPIRQTRFPTATLPNGGEAQQLVTEAFLARAFRADIALQNSGGVRIDLPAGDLTIGQAYTLLPFANTLYELDLTGAEIQLALEQGLSNRLDNGGSTGAFPYGAGIRWDLNATRPFGERFSNIEVRPKGTTEWVPLSPTATYVVVANSFMANGGDGYQALEDAVDDGRGVDTFLDYAQSFIDYVQDEAGGVISPPTEFSTRSYIDASATVSGAPTAVTAVAGNAEATVSWTAPTADGGAPITGYTVAAAPGGATCTTTGALTCTVTGLTNGTAHTFTVVATNGVGNSAASEPSNSVTPTAPTTVPGAPTGVSAVPGDRRLTVSWTAPASTGGAAITDYVVQYRRVGASTWTTAPDGVSTATTAVVTGLTNGTAYQVRVAAVNSVGQSTFAQAAASQTPRTKPAAPGRPTGTAGNKRVALRWTAPGNTGGAAITDYVVQVRKVGASKWSTFKDGRSTATRATVTGLRNGTRYEFRVAAVNASGRSDFSRTSAAVRPVR
jgi:5'-nucleotidase